jgi:hypothetical protein
MSQKILKIELIFDFSFNILGKNKLLIVVSSMILIFWIFFLCFSYSSSTSQHTESFIKRFTLGLVQWLMPVNPNYSGGSDREVQ